MKTTLKLAVAFSLFISFTFVSCDKDDDNGTPSPRPIVPTDTTTTGSLKIQFDNKVGSQNLVLSPTQWYVTENSDTFNVSLFRYYISNIVLTKSNGDTYKEKNSYHLVDASVDSSNTLTITGVPLGTYTSISFMIGVDSIRNVSGAQTGALDPAKGMFWSWSSGYIMAKFEGETSKGTMLMYHPGGFSGANNVLKTVTPSLGSNTANVTKTVTPSINIKTDLLEWFKTPNTINLETFGNIHMPGSQAKKIADNYEDMFSVISVNN